MLCGDWMYQSVKYAAQNQICFDSIAPKTVIVVRLYTVFFLQKIINALLTQSTNKKMKVTSFILIVTCFVGCISDWGNGKFSECVNCVTFYMFTCLFPCSVLYDWNSVQQCISSTHIELKRLPAVYDVSCDILALVSSMPCWGALVPLCFALHRWSVLYWRTYYQGPHPPV